MSNTAFESHGVKLVGRLVLSKGSGKIPVVVLVHGSEHGITGKPYVFTEEFPTTHPQPTEQPAVR